MIKGKLYTGLPSEMMNKSRVVNRQETNFFWPDESDMESVSTKSKRTTPKATTPIANNNNDSIDLVDIKPKELFRKQLASGIEFYDNVNAKTPESRRRRFKKIDNVNLNNSDSQYQPERKKLETFSSKIEFYDFEIETDVKNEKNKKMEQPVKPMKKDDHDNVKIMKKESPELTKKRISFQTEEKTKGILKKNDDKITAEKVVVKPLPKRGLLPRNLSKSVENISKMAKNAVEDDLKGNKEPEKLSTIINEVKKMNLNERKKNYERNRPDDDDDGYYGYSSRKPYEREPRRNNIDKEYSSRYSERFENHREYRDEPDYNHYDSDERRYRKDVARNNYRNDRHDDRRERHRDFNDYDRYERPERVYRSQPREYDDRRYDERSNRYNDEPIRGKYSPEYSRHPIDREYEREPKKETHKEPIYDRKSTDSYREKPTQKLRYEDEYSTAISQPTRQLPQHLRTNILSNGHVRPQSQRPLSVRDSAVTRVGVGLPDIE